jgi:hypothetical protein
VFGFWLLLVFAVYRFLTHSTSAERAGTIGFVLALFCPWWLLAALIGFVVGLLFRPAERQLRFDTEGKLLSDDKTCVMVSLGQGFHNDKSKRRNFLPERPGSPETRLAAKVGDRPSPGR